MFTDQELQAHTNYRIDTMRQEARAIAEARRRSHQEDSRPMSRRVWGRIARGLRQAPA